MRLTPWFFETVFPRSAAPGLSGRPPNRKIHGELSAPRASLGSKKSPSGLGKVAGGCTAVRLARHLGSPGTAPCAVTSPKTPAPRPCEGWAAAALARSELVVTSTGAAGGCSALAARGDCRAPVVHVPCCTSPALGSHRLDHVPLGEKGIFEHALHVHVYLLVNYIAVLPR